MTDVPERLWAWCFNGDKFGGWRKWGGYARPENRYPLNDKERQTGAEYIRADLPRPQDAARIAELEAENARLMSDLAAKGPWPKPPDGARCSPPSYEMDPFSVKYVFGSGWTLFKSRRECGSKCTVRGYDSAESALAAMVHVRAALAADSGAAE